MFKHIDELNQGERAQLFRSNSSPSFYINLYDYKFDPNINTYLYYIDIGIQMDTDTIVVKKFVKRYSELYEIWYKLSEKYDILKTETFPGKLWFNKNDSTKIKNRFEHIKSCLSKVCEIDDNKFIYQIIHDN